MKVWVHKSERYPDFEMSIDAHKWWDEVEVDEALVNKFMRVRAEYEDVSNQLKDLSDEQDEKA